MKNDTDYFENIIGQDAAKKALRFRLENYNRSGILPHLLFNAPKGCGKTLLARTVGKALKGPDGSPKRFVEINCASVKNLKQFCETFLLQHVADKDVTVHLDEASELPKDVEMALLTILNPNDTDKTTFAYEDFLLDFDFRRQTFLFSTTEAHQMFGALKDRLKRVDLQVYSKQDLQGIIALNLKKAKIKFNNSVLPEIATVLRGNARQAVSMAKTFRALCRAKASRFRLSIGNKCAMHWRFCRLALAPAN